MTQHYLESTSISLSPQLFVFAQNLSVQDCEKEPEESINQFDVIWKQFEDNFETQQQIGWEKHWLQQGEAIVQHQWQIKFGDYLLQTKKEEAEASLPSVEVEQICKSNERLSQDTNEHSASWQELWEQHVQEIYLEQYTLYTSIYYNHYLNFKQAIQTEDPFREEAIATHEKTEETEEVAAEFEQLQLLGLPTAFGGRPQNNHKRRSVTNQNENNQTLSTQHFADLFSSSDEEKEDDFMADESEENPFLHAIQHQAITKTKNEKIKKQKKNRNLRKVPDFMREDKQLLRYWQKRFSLFSRFDEGIRLDRESWFSVTPERVAKHLAERLTCDLLIDGFCGSGGNAIQFAKTCGRVIAIDIDPVKVEMAKHNARIYGVADRIEFIVGDFLQLCSDGGRLRGDVVFLSPPWGGPKYKKCKDYDIEKSLLPIGASELVEHVRKVSDNVALFLPRNSNMRQIIKIAGVGNRCEVEHSYLDTRLVAITALYGEAILHGKK